jgi:cobyrinic acid a,c-diamide synthase
VNHLPFTEASRRSQWSPPILAQPDAPLARVADATGAPVAETGSGRVFAAGGRVTGTFFHMIGEAS